MKVASENKFTATHRIFHWSIAILMALLFLTGFLRMEWMSKKNIISSVEQHAGAAVNNEQARAIAKEVLAPMWEWHIIAAYILVFIFLGRIIYMLLKGIRFPNPFKKRQAIKLRFQGFLYCTFYLLVFIMIVTGLYLNLGAGDWKQPMEKIHKLAIYWFPIFIGFHLIGIVIGELTDKKGITSKMISG